MSESKAGLVKRVLVVNVLPRHSLKGVLMRSPFAAIVLVPCFCLVGCSNWSTPQSEKAATPGPRVMVKRAPCKLKFGPLAATLEVDLSELKNLVLDTKQLYSDIVNGEPGVNPPEKGNPVIMVVNKQDNRFTYFQLTPNIKEVRLKSNDTKGVVLIVKNQEPLQIELWIDTPQEVYFDVEFKER
jgi:hypothetical protein